MAAAARERGYGYLAVTDHSASHGFGDDVTDDQLRERVEEVAELNADAQGQALPGARRLRGQHRHRRVARLPDELLASLDWVIASVHTSFRISEKEMTEAGV